MDTLNTWQISFGKIVDQNNKTICGLPKRKNNDAAHIIAAAPELLSACQTLLELFESGQNYETRNPYTRPEVKAAINAIAKAKGEIK
jgi:hypothetical protein